MRVPSFGAPPAALPVAALLLAALSGAPSPDDDPSATAVGSQVFVWSGHLGPLTNAEGYRHTGGLYDLSGRSWIDVTSSPSLPRGWICSPWTPGHEAIELDGKALVSGGSCTNGGGIFDPHMGGPLAVRVPEGRSFHTLVKAGSDVIAWGGISIDVKTLPVPGP